MAHVVNKTQNFELPFSWITLIQEGFQITLTKLGADLLLPPYQATIVPGSSTSKHGSGAEIGASSQSCSLSWNCRALALMIVTLETLLVQSFDVAAVKASDFVLLFVAVSLSRSQLSILIGCFMEISFHGSLPAGMFFILQCLDIAGVVFRASPLSNVDGFGLASWFYLVTAFADLDVVAAVCLLVVGVVACFAAMRPVVIVLDFGYPAVLDMLLFLKLAGFQLDILLVVGSVEEPILLHCAALSTLRSGCGMILAAGLLGLLELRIAPATPTANLICKRESVPLI
ncbi:hypothetical protein NC653_031963 [Populus alba x Populus x berolinensis]|uniref:Uncharacterized protein n=2 Tax=Populus TaxID=3689 RepID=A0A4U5QHD5_POPAL|nr:hypothetical protein NC653_031963 [Populus alba x Populus x berolinensis]TKS08447.1 hypothetical protein D5086_0000103280 [Populus alba]